MLQFKVLVTGWSKEKPLFLLSVPEKSSQVHRADLRHEKQTAHYAKVLGLNHFFSSIFGDEFDERLVSASRQGLEVILARFATENQP